MQAAGPGRAVRPAASRSRGGWVVHRRRCLARHQRPHELERVAIDALTLDVNIDDLTFASSTGSLLHAMEAGTTMPYGTAMGCDCTSNGVGRIDLQGIPFVVGADYCVSGVGQSGEADVQNEDAVVSLTGGGSCGRSAPNPDCPFNPSTGMTGARLPLIYAP